MTTDNDDNGPDLFPTLDDVSLRSSMLRDFEVQLLDDRSFRCLMHLVRLCAAARAWTYSEPDAEGWVHGDDAGMARVAGVSRSLWLAKIKPALLPFLQFEEGRFRVDRDWFITRAAPDEPLSKRRSQTIHPRIFSDEAFVSVSAAARVLLIGLGTLADEAKRFPWNEDLIASALAHPTVAAELIELETASLVAREGRQGLILFGYGLSSIEADTPDNEEDRS